MNPRYPIYIVSKSRWDSRLTSKALENMNVPYYIVVEASQYDQYCAVIDPKKVLILPQEYLDNYDTFDDLGATKSKGPGAARNFAWDHSIKLGAKWHWVMDDNITSFQRLNRNLMIKCKTGAIFLAAEDFVDRYENIAQAGFNYDFFARAKAQHPAIIFNTRIYSCLLIRNDMPYRWRGRYNEDTDLSLRMLKDGYCTIQFNAFIQEKMQTQQLKGGNTEAFYAKEGTLPKSEMLVAMHPDVSMVVFRFARWHHHVNYLPFKKNRLIKKKGLVIPEGVNDYGMVITDKSNL